MKSRNLRFTVIASLATLSIGYFSAAQAADEGRSAAVEYLQATFEMSEAAAVERLENERAAARINTYAVELTEDDYAGSWFSAETGRLVVAVVDDAKFPILEELGAVPVRHEHSITQLSNEVNKITAFSQANDTAELGLVSWGVDYETNSLVVEHLEGHRLAAEQVIGALGIGSVPVTYKPTEGFPDLAYNVYGGEETENTTQGFSCSIGFSIEDGYIIAGHCGDKDDDVDGKNGVAQGIYAASDWPSTDRAWVETNSSWTPKPSFYNYSGGNDDITASMSGLETSTVNSTVCRYGITTGAECGQITSLSKQQTFNTPSDGPVTLSGLIETTACVDFGDSGGPLLSGSGYHAQGTTVGGYTGTCPQPSGKHSYFEHATNTISDYNRILLTQHGANSPDAGTIACFNTGSGSYLCTLSDYDSQGWTTVSWSTSTSDYGSGMSMTGSCSTSDTVYVDISASNPYGSDAENSSFWCSTSP